MPGKDESAELLLLPHGFDWYLLIGDETGLPGIERELRHLSGDCRVAVFLEVDMPETRRDLDTDSSPYIEWFYRNNIDDNRDFKQGLEKLYIPGGKGFAWATGKHEFLGSVGSTLLNHHAINVSLFTQPQQSSGHGIQRKSYEVRPIKKSFW